MWTGDKTRIRNSFFLVSHMELKPYLQQFHSSEIEREKWAIFRKMISGREQDRCPQMEQRERWEKAEARSSEDFAHVKVCFKIRISALTLYIQHQETVI